MKPGSRELAERRRVAGGLRDTHARLWEKRRGFLNPEERRKISTEESWVGNLARYPEREREREREESERSERGGLSRNL